MSFGIQTRDLSYDYQPFPSQRRASALETRHHVDVKKKIVIAQFEASSATLVFRLGRNYSANSLTAEISLVFLYYFMVFMLYILSSRL